MAQFRDIGLLELAAAIGVLAGLVVPMLGMAAGVGIVLLMTAALVVPYRNRDLWGPHDPDGRPRVVRGRVRGVDGCLSLIGKRRLDPVTFSAALLSGRGMTSTVLPRAHSPATCVATRRAIARIVQAGEYA